MHSAKGNESGNALENLLGLVNEMIPVSAVVNAVQANQGADDTAVA